ncbi:retrovirus-related pol polyprotein from transposon TNT 1-94, partial [Tanacetum coccineum]
YLNIMEDIKRGPYSKKTPCRVRGDGVANPKRWRQDFQDDGVRDLATASERVDNSFKTRRPHPRSNTNNDRVPSVSKSSCIKNKDVEVEEHHRNLLLSKNKEHMSSECNNIKLAIQNDKSEVVCAMCNQCLITSNHDVCVLNYVNDMNSRADNQKANVSNIANQKKHKYNIMKTKKIGSNESLASPKPRKPRTCLRTVRFGNGHIATILGYDDLQWGNILITMVYFVEGLGHNLFSVGQFYDSDLEGKSKKASHPPKPVPNSKQRLHLLHMDLCGPMRVESINGQRYILVIVDDYSRYTDLCYPKNNREDIRKLGAKGDIGFFIGYSANSCAYRVYNRRTRNIIETMNVTFYELSAMAFEKRIAENVTNAMFVKNTFVNPFALPSISSAKSSSQYVDPSNMHTFYQPCQHNYQWTKDHPLEQVIGEPSRPVLTRNQLRSDGEICIYALTVSTMEPRNIKEVMTDPAWIESMLEELLQFKGLMYGC